MIRYIVSIILIVALLTAAQVGYAQNEQFDLKVSVGTYMVTIAGKLTDNASGQRVAIRVLDEEGGIAHFSQFNASHGGEYSYSFELASGGDFTLYLKSDIDPAKAPFEYEFSIVSLAELEDYMNEINGAPSKEVMAQKIAQYKNILGISDPIIDSLVGSSYFENAVADIFAEKESDLSIAELFEALKISCAIQMLNSASDGEAIGKALTDFATIYKLDELDIYDKYAGMNDTSKGKVWQAMASAPTIYQKDSYQDYFAERVFAVALSESFVGQVIGILTEFNSYLNLQPPLSALSFEQRNAVTNALAGKSCTFSQAESTYSSAANMGGGGGGGGGGGSQAFSNVTVDSELQSVTPLVKPPLFIDLEEAEWAKEYILRLVEMKVIDGYEDRTVRPNNLIVREEYLKLLLTAFDMIDDEAVATFTDVNEEDWFYPYVATAQKYAIVRGVGEDEFGVGLNISRQDMCVMAYRIAVRTGVRIEPSASGEVFADDDDISDYAEEIVYTLRNEGIISGVGENRFNPLGTATRAEASKVILELIDYNRSRSEVASPDGKE